MATNAWITLERYGNCASSTHCPATSLCDCSGRRARGASWCSPRTPREAREHDRGGEDRAGAWDGGGDAEAADGQVWKRGTDVIEAVKVGDWILAAGRSAQRGEPRACVQVLLRAAGAIEQPPWRLSVGV